MPVTLTPQQTTTTVTTTQIDINSIVNQIIPIMVLMLLFGMLTPMMREMATAFK